ncbi:hypothetical protein FRB94_007224 [Tulasnella sp. JGI-2019a]|nr:hypothetical protein FRB94_007224 [Tulasnella sp. JGI-2019a]KAG9010585.1 hypothetical protein FRB93_003853 [Tulasnella sp. JGI-2019a]KAG9027929.1 hypothetical protein FRB95_007058 [Tulasnella sp. JGI-2019a]
MSQIDSGVYMIMDKKTNNPVGRFPVEDLSLLPKRVVVIPQGMQAPHWVVQKNGDGTYNLKAGGASVAGMDRDGMKLFAVLIDEMAPPDSKKWNINPTGDGAYCVQLASQGNPVWDTSNLEPGMQGQLKVAPQGSSDCQKFMFVRLDRE